MLPSYNGVNAQGFLYRVEVRVATEHRQTGAERHRGDEGIVSRNGPALGAKAAFQLGSHPPIISFERDVAAEFKCPEEVGLLFRPNAAQELKSDRARHRCPVGFDKSRYSVFDGGIPTSTPKLNRDGTPACHLPA